MTPPRSSTDPVEQRAVRRASVRLIWFLALLYLLNNIDRTNIGFASLTMSRATGLTAQTFGIGVSAFYVGYLLFEIPSNIILARTGARRSLARMAIGSGLATMLMVLVQGPATLYLVRALLGLAESGYLVGIVLYLSYWFPAEHRARLNSVFMLSLPLAFAVSSAIAGFILGLDGLFGIAGWRWLFITEGAPAIVAGIICLRFLQDRPEQAGWLSPEERVALAAAVRRDGVSRERSPADMLREVPVLLRNRFVIVNGLVYAGVGVGLISLTSWMPTVVKGFDLPAWKVGFVTMIAPLTAAVVMVGWSRWSDRRQERVLNAAAAQLVAAIGWAVAASARDPALIVFGFTIAAVGIYSTYSISFTFTQSYVRPEQRPVAIAIVGTMGSLGGIIVPALIGTLKTRTGNFQSGFLTLSGLLIFTALCTTFLLPAVRRFNQRTEQVGETDELGSLRDDGRTRPFC